jgi:hypothetical protein
MEDRWQQHGLREGALGCFVAGRHHACLLFPTERRGFSTANMTHRVLLDERRPPGGLVCVGSTFQANVLLKSVAYDCAAAAVALLFLF